MIDVYNSIIKNTSFLKEDATFQERIYCIRNNISNIVLCKECNKNTVKFDIRRNIYRSFCCNKCSRNNSDSINLRKINMIKNHGCENWVNVEKIRESKLKNHGDPNYSNREKSVRTLKEHYEKDPEFKINQVKKLKATKKKKYGNENWVNPQKAIKTLREKYGDDSIKTALLLPSSIEKTKYGTRKRSFKFILKNKKIIPLFSEHDYSSGIPTDKFKFKCVKCGTEFKSVWENGILRDPCPVCHPIKHGSSSSEIEVFDYIKSIVPNNWKVYNRDHINRSIIAPQEIDIVICDDKNIIKLLIEYDGLFYHSTNCGKSKTYHLTKTKLCNKKGYRLIHIFENEWLSKQEIVMAKLFNIINTPSNNIDINMCTIKLINDNNIVEEFMVENNLNGYVKSNVNIGLYYNDNLISLCSFSKSRFTDKYDWELVRFCSQKNIHTFGLDKILKYFELSYKPKSLVSYQDIRWSDGTDIINCGFRIDHISRPNYWYFKLNTPTIIYNRLSFNNDNIKSIVKKYNHTNSIEQNLFDNNYGKIYDCGNLVLVKSYN